MKSGLVQKDILNPAPKESGPKDLLCAIFFPPVNKKKMWCCVIHNSANDWKQNVPQRNVTSFGCEWRSLGISCWGLEIETKTPLLLAFSS